MHTHKKMIPTLSSSKTRRTQQCGEEHLPAFLMHAVSDLLDATHLWSPDTVGLRSPEQMINEAYQSHDYRDIVSGPWTNYLD